MAKTNIYYLTGTGNSLKIAKDLRQKIGDCELHSMTLPITKIEGDTVGIIFPVYFARPPVFIQELIDRIKIGDSKYLFLIANGGGLFGAALKILQAQLHSKGLTVHAGFLIGMPGNHPKIASMQKKTAEMHYAREKKRIGEISGFLVNKLSSNVETNMGPLGRFFSHIGFRSPYNLSQAHRLDEAFRVTDRCIGCGTCERVCRVGNIRRATVTGKPEWQHQCINCAACYHHCPQEAIEFSGVKHQMKRYRHPEVALEEIMV